MKLQQSINNLYRCDLTKELDDISEISKHHYYKAFCHYVLVEEWCKNKKHFPIRVPGGTVGWIYFDGNNIITKIVIDTNYVVKEYPVNVNELIKRFVGEAIEW